MRFVLLVVALMSAGCGVSLRSSLDAWHPSGRASQLDESDRALLARMVVDAPTDDAMDAREHIDELGEVGDADVQALLVSSLRWLEIVAATHLDELGDDRCDAGLVLGPPRPGPEDRGDVIGSLSSTRQVLDGVSISPLRSHEHMGLAVVWSRVEFRDHDCARAYRALRALAITRGWLGAHVDDMGVLEVFRGAVEQLRGGAPPCNVGGEAQMATAIARHFHELDPRGWSEADPAPNACQVSTLGGPFGGMHRTLVGPAHPPSPPSDPEPAIENDVIDTLATRYSFTLDESPAVRPDDDALAIEVSWGFPGPFGIVFVARRAGEWRVIDIGAFGQACAS